MSTPDQDRTEGQEPQSPGVTRWRKKPVTVEMIRWDGSDEAERLIREHGGYRPRAPMSMRRDPEDGALNIWVEASCMHMWLQPGDWAAIEPDGSGVYPIRANDHAAAYEPASSAEDRTEGKKPQHVTTEDGLGPACLDSEPLSEVPGEVTVGEVRALLAKHGVPHTDDTHYVIVASAGESAGQMSILGCCDYPDHTAALLGEALQSLTGEGRELAPESPSVIVGREDLVAVLREAEGFIGGKDNLPFARLAAAAGVE